MKPVRLIPSLLAIVLTAACTQFIEGPTSSPEAPLPTEGPSSQAETTNTAKPPTKEPGSKVLLIDALDREVEFESQPDRIVVAGRAGQLLIHTAYLFPEAEDRLVGMEQRLQREASMIPLVDANYAEKVQFDRDVGAEGIASVQPEAVLMKSYLADSLGAPVETLGILPVYLDLETPEQFFRDLETLGQLFGNPGRAEWVAQFYRSMLDQLESMLTDLDDSERPSILLLQYSDRGGEVAFNVPSASWLQTELIRLAGGDPVWIEAAQGGGWTVVNLEQIASWDPDQIFIVNYFGDPDVTVDELQADPTWSGFRAVKEDQIFAMPGDYLSWDQPDPRWILSLQWLATKIQPERTSSLDILDEYYTFYRELYGIEDRVIESEIMPLITGDFE